MISSHWIEIIGPALVVGLMISLTHAPLGIEVLRRGIIFIDLAVAQIAGLGLLATSLYLEDSPWWLGQLAALLGAITAGGFFRWIERNMPKQQEAIIGSSFVLAASLSLLLLADHPHGGEEVQHLLSGQILFVGWKDLLSHAPVYLFILTVWFLKPAVKTDFRFYLLFALGITSSVQLVGVYVVFASLILPALAAFTYRRKHLIAWTCGLSSVLTGILMAVLLDLPAGPTIVISYVGVACLFKGLGTLS